MQPDPPTQPAPSPERVAWVEQEARKLILAGGTQVRLEPWPAKAVKLAISFACATVVVLTLSAPLYAWRRYIAKSAAAKGLCTHCGYNVAALPTCPECGTPNQRSTSTPNAHQP